MHLSGLLKKHNITLHIRRRTAKQKPRLDGRTHSARATIEISTVHFMLANKTIFQNKKFQSFIRTCFLVTAKEAPLEVKLRKSKQELEIIWPDKTFVFPAELLRVESPSVEVQGVLEGQKKVRTSSK